MAEGGAKGLKGFLDQLDGAVDSRLNVVFDPRKPVVAKAEARRAGRFLKRRAASAGKSASKAGGGLARLQSRGLRYITSLSVTGKGKSPVRKILAHPRMVLVASFVAAFMLATPSVFIFGYEGLGIKSGMRADLEVFLPADDPATQILKEIRGRYPTDVAIALFDLYVPDANITSVRYMKEISGFEGDVDHLDAAGNLSGVDYRLDDIGLIDGVNWTLSLPTIIKAYNVTPSNFEQAMHDLWGFPPQAAIVNASYAIPDDQGSIDNVISQMGSDYLRSFIVNRENVSGGLFNRVVVLFGLSSDLDAQNRVLSRAESLASAFNEGNDGNLVVRITGPVAVFRDLQQGVSRELGKALPFIIFGLLGVLYFWHRNWRVLILTLVPVTLGSMMAYGITGAAHAANPGAVILAPQVVLAMPMLLAIGVSYGLYIANRFVEETGPTREERIASAVERINPALFLSAVATSIGFFALMIGTLPPIWTLGLTLTIGMALTYILVYALIPCFVAILGYEKNVRFHEMKKIAGVGERRRVIITLISLMLVAASLGVLFAGKISFDVDYLTMTPEGTPSVEAMRDYSSTMGGGQLGIVLSKAKGGSFNQLAALDELEHVQSRMSGITNVQAISIVTIMKLVKSPSEVQVGGQTIQLPADSNFWDLLHSTDQKTVQSDMLALFYGSVPAEMRSMLVDPDLKSAVIYIQMPFLGVDPTRLAVDSVNGAIDGTVGERQATQVEHMAGIQTVTLAVNDLIIEAQVTSLIVALFLTFLHIWAVFGDFRVALITMAPVSVVCIMEPLILVLFNIPLSTVTVMIGSIAIGTGVDFAVQITQRMRLEGYDQVSLNRAVETTGVSFIEATSTMVVGFAGMLVMNIQSIQQFVLMLILLLVLNMIMAMFLFPALGSIWIRRRRKVPPPEGIYVKLMKSIKEGARRPKPGVAMAPTGPPALRAEGAKE